MKKKRLLTGDRPSGSSYTIGAYIGTFKSRLEAQEDNSTDCFIFSADYHTLTTNIEKTSEFKQNTIDLIKTQLSVGINPEKCVFYRQSKIVETFRLHTILSMITSMAELQRQPALKEKISQGKAMTYGLVGYPVLMSSDILLMKSTVVPVGKDQEAHVEIAQLLAKKFNSLFGSILNVPEKLINPVVVGLDGKGKSGKSTGGIFFNDNSEDVKKKVMSMYTDPNRLKATDPGKVEGNPVFIYHDFFNNNLEEVNDLKERYVKGGVGDVEVKEKLYNALEVFLEPIRQKRSEVDKLGDEYILGVLEEGEKKANIVANETMANIIDAMGF